jgi:hypothetical protein
MPRPQSAHYRARPRWNCFDAQSALSALDASGLSVRAFARREGLDPQRLYHWRKRLGAKAVEALPTVVDFVELRPLDRERIEIVLRSGRLMRVGETVDPAALVRIVATLEQSEPC